MGTLVRYQMYDIFSEGCKMSEEGYFIGRGVALNEILKGTMAEAF